MNKVLKKISTVLHESELIERSSIIHLSRAKIPILKCKNVNFGYRFDISVNQRLGIKQVGFITNEVTKRPYLKQFSILLKHFLKVRGLNESSRGGMCAYAQFLMLLSFFQLHPLLQTEGIIDPLENIGVLFMDFFQFYSFDFNYQNVTISVRDAMYKRNTSDEAALSIEDPVDETHDVGYFCTNMASIRDVFSHSYRVMACVVRGVNRPEDSLLSLWMGTSKNEEMWRINVIEEYRACSKPR
jgi:non-canonical poly(A) RNA polymerase PAPD5/7